MSDLPAWRRHYRRVLRFEGRPSQIRRTPARVCEILDDNSNSRENDARKGCESCKKGDEDATVCEILDDESWVTDARVCERWLSPEGCRAAVCCLAVLLLWCCSLSSARSLLQASSPPPSLRSVHHTCQFALREVFQQQQWYEKCAHQQLERCTSTRDETLYSAQQKLQEIKLGNEMELERVNEFVSVCEEKKNLLFGVLEDASSVSYKDSCEKEDREKLQGKIGDRAAAGRSAEETTERYVKNSRDVVSSLAKYSTDLQAYNKAYIANKTQSIQRDLNDYISITSEDYLIDINDTFASLSQAMDNLVTCISLNSTANSKNCDHFPATVAELYSDMQRTILSSKNGMLKSIDMVEIQVGNFVTLTESAIAQANNFFDAVSGIGGAMQWINNNLVSLSPVPVSLCDVGSGSSWCSFSKSMWHVASPAFPNIQEVIDVPSSGEIWKQVEGVVDNNLKSNEEILNNVLADNHAWADSLVEYVNNNEILLFEDYNPPQYMEANSTDGAADRFAYESEDYLNLMEGHVANLTASFNIDSDTFNSSQFTITDSASVNSNDQSEHDFSFRSINLLENLDIIELIEQLGGISEMLILMDFIFRLIQTFRLIRKYWDKSAISLPVVDMSDRMKASCSPKDGMVSALYTSLTLLGHIWIAAFVLILFIAFFGIYITVLYIPTFKEYQSICVYNHKNESFISSNLHSIAYNYASDAGHNAIFQGLAGYDTSSTQSCSTYASEARNSYDLLMKDLVTLGAKHETVASDTHLAKSCINETEMASSMLLSDIFNPLNAQHNSSQSKNIVLPESCAESIQKNFQQNIVDNITPVNNMFNCSTALPVCRITCSGPNTDMLHVMAKQCSCMTEWLFHSSILNTVAILAVYILINISRYCICRAITIFLWKKLSTDKSFLFKGSCQENGSIILPNSPHNTVSDGEHDTCSLNMEHVYTDKTFEVNQDIIVRINEKSHTNQYNETCYRDQLHESLRHALNRFTMKGYFFLFLSIIANVPWIIFIILVNAHMSYNPS